MMLQRLTKFCVQSPTDFVTDDRNVTEDTNEDTFTTGLFFNMFCSLNPE